ncbi:hypothetical protein AURDEDRAFT_156028 [Auricularia subglabra TFB-10046 SS5]|nr:hypothetical protein AURDEDRAFT_156028 [Auricularia subglabra TFB-10046 SS5]
MRFITVAVLALTSLVAATPSALSTRAKEKDQPPAGCAQLPSGTVSDTSRGGMIVCGVLFSDVQC